MPKYYIDNNTSFVVGKNKILHPIVAEETFVNGATGITIEAGEIGGYVESTSNLSALRESTAWIFPNCFVYGGSYVFDSAAIMNGANVYDNSTVASLALVDGNIYIKSFSIISGMASIRTSNRCACIISHSHISAGRINTYETPNPAVGNSGIFHYIIMKTPGIEVSGSIFIRGNQNKGIEITENLKGNGETITDQRQLSLFY